MTNPPVSIALAFLTNLSYIVFLKTSISTTSLIFFLNQQDHVLTYQHLIYLFYLLNCLNHLVHFLIYQYLRGMLHVGEVKFNLGWVFFWDTRAFYLGLKSENFDPRVKWIFWSFCMIFWMFSFYENTDILTSYNW